MTIGNYTGDQHGVGYRHDRASYFCHLCYQFTCAEADGSDPRRCSTPGCTRAVGFGKFGSVRVSAASSRTGRGSSGEARR
jgi:hypothetical protein